MLPISIVSPKGLIYAHGDWSQGSWNTQLYVILDIIETSKAKKLGRRIREPLTTVGARIIRMPRLFPCKQFMQNWRLWLQNASNYSKCDIVSRFST